MKKLTLSALAVLAVAGTSFAGPTVVTSKEFKQPCVTPCFRDQEFQLDLFYSYNDAVHQGNRTGSDSFSSGTLFTPVAPGALPGATTVINDPLAIVPGSSVVRSADATIKAPQYFHDGSGGGVGLNYFFTRFIGVGVEGNWWDGCQSGFSAKGSTQDVVVGVPAGTSPVVSAATLAADAAAAGYTVVTSADGTTVLLRKSDSRSNTHKSAAQQVTGSLILRYPFEGPICWAPYIFGGGGGIFDGKATGFGHVGLGAEWRVTPYMGFFSDWRWEFTGGGNTNNDFRNSNVADFVNARIDNNRSRNDVTVSRVGVRFVF